MEKEQRKEIAQTIISQLGGKRFMLMTGVKQFFMEECGVSFKLGKNKSKARHVRIEYDYGRDLYNVVFGREKRTKNKELSMPGLPMWDYSYEELERTNGVYFDMLEEMFENYTGMYLRL